MSFRGIVPVGLASLFLLIGCQTNERDGDFRMLFAGLKNGGTGQASTRGTTVSIGCLQAAKAQGISASQAATSCTTSAAIAGTNGAVRGINPWSLWWWSGWSSFVNTFNNGCTYYPDGSYSCVDPQVQVYQPTYVHPPSFFSWCGLNWNAYCGTWGTCGVNYSSSYGSHCTDCLMNYENKDGGIYKNVRQCLRAYGCWQYEYGG